jgi:hypothetical protein
MPLPQVQEKRELRLAKAEVAGSSTQRPLKRAGQTPIRSQAGARARSKSVAYTAHARDIWRAGLGRFGTQKPTCRRHANSREGRRHLDHVGVVVGSSRKSAILVAQCSARSMSRR